MDNDWLDDLLRQRPEDIADGGFSARVLRALPAIRKPWYASRDFILLAASTAACGVALAIPGLADYVIDSLIGLLTLKSVTVETLAVLVPVTLLYWTAISAVAHES